MPPQKGRECCPNAASQDRESGALPTYRSDRACAPTDGRTFNLARQTTWRWRRWRGPRQRAYRADIYVYTSYLLQSLNAHKPLIRYVQLAPIRR